MPARHISFDRLDAAAQERVIRLLQHPPVHAEPAGGAAGAWAALAVAGALVAGAGWQLGFGMVVTAIGAAMLVRGGLGAWRGWRRSKLPWAPGRFLYPFGFVDARSSRLRILPITDFSGFQVKSSPGQSGGPGLITIIADFRHADPETFAIFGTERNVPRDKLEALRGEPSELLEQLPPATPGGSGESLPVRHPWVMSVLAALAVIAVTKLVIEPSRTGDQRAARKQRLDEARAALPGKLQPDAVAAFDRLIAHATASGSSTVEVAVLPDTGDWDRITAWLEEQARGLGATAAPVAFRQTGDDYFIRALDVVVPGRVLDFRSFGLGYQAPAGTPRVTVDVELSPGTVYRAESGRLFAGFTTTFTASLRFGDEPAIPLGKPIVVEPPAELEVSRLTFEGDEPLPALGDSGGMEDVLIYGELMSRASQAAASQLAASLVR